MIELAGRIVDPTRWVSGLACFPALRFAQDELLDPVVDCAKLPLSWQYHVSLQDNPAYHQALQDARSLAQSQLDQAQEIVIQNHVVNLVHAETDARIAAAGRVHFLLADR